jgi:hypothetical protein
MILPRFTCRDTPARGASRVLSAPIVWLERAVPRSWGVNPTRCTRWNDLDSDGFCLYCAFVADNVHMASTWVNKPHPCRVHMGRAIGIIPIVGRHCSRRDGDQAMARVCGALWQPRTPGPASGGLRPSNSISLISHSTSPTFASNGVNTFCAWKSAPWSC